MKLSVIPGQHDRPTPATASFPAGPCRQAVPAIHTFPQQKHPGQVLVDLRTLVLYDAPAQSPPDSSAQREILRLLGRSLTI